MGRCAAHSACFLRSSRISITCVKVAHVIEVIEMKFPLDATKLTVLSGAGEVSPVMAYDSKGNVTDEPAVDEQGRKTYKLRNALLNSDGQLSTDTTIKTHSLPAKLEAMRPYRLVNPVLSVWKGRVSVTADALEAI